MPTHQGIYVALISQYDALPMTEYEPSTAVQTGAYAVERAIQVCPATQFWLRYSCDPPLSTSDTRFYYFKLFSGDHCLASWGTGKKNSWKGSVTSFPTQSNTDLQGYKVQEKCGLLIQQLQKRDSEASPSTIEVRVFRARARKREPRQYMSVAEVEGGILSEDPLWPSRSLEPQRYYTYALKDPMDDPHVVFRYTLCSRCDGRGDCLIRVVMLTRATDIEAQASSFQVRGQSMNHSERPESRKYELTSGTLSPALGPLGSSEEGLGHLDGVERQRRLSIPPSNVFTASNGTKEPRSPVKKEVASLDHHYAVTASAGWQSTEAPNGPWSIRTPSPVKNDRGRYERAATPPAIKKTGSTISLKGLISSALGRKGS